MRKEALDRRILREIRDGLKASRAAVEEYDRLQAVLKALGPSTGGTRAPARASRSRRAPTKTRARRGANREKALLVIADRPGVTLAELASATGIAKNVLYSLTRSLTGRGQIERVALPGGTFGFRIAQATEQANAGADGNAAAN